MMPWFGMQCSIVFPGHTHLLVLKYLFQMYNKNKPSEKNAALFKYFTEL